MIPDHVVVAVQLGKGEYKCLRFLFKSGNPRLELYLGRGKSEFFFEDLTLAQVLTLEGAANAMAQTMIEEGRKR